MENNSTELATEFVNRYPLMFVSDKDWWIEKIAELMRDYHSYKMEEIDRRK